MFLSAEELVAPGGPSAPVWAFLTTITIAVIALIGQQLKSRSDLKQIKAQGEAAKSEATKAHQSAEKAQENTVSVSNGFTGRVDKKLDRIYEALQSTDKALRDHLEWHLEKER